MQPETQKTGFKNTTVFYALLVFAVALFVAMVCIFFYVQNNWIGITRYSIELNSDKPDNPQTGSSAPNPIKIVHLSDLHGNYLGGDNKDLLRKIKDIAPDMVVITGDWIDQGTKYPAFFANLIKTIEAMSPVFYIPGNHEHWLGKMPEWKNILQNNGVEMMQNEIRTVEIKGRKVNVLGLDEAIVSLNTKEQTDLFKTLESTEGLKIVLGHYPENFFYPRDFFYKNMKFDLFFCGHAHGGQFRLPIIGGVFSPGQGFFPMLYEGVHFSDDEKVQNNYFKSLNKKNSQANSITNSKSISLATANGTAGKPPAMIISRGLGNSVIPQRLFNRPEIVVVEVQ